MDYIGVDAYYPLADRPDSMADALAHAWVDRGYVARLAGLSQQYGRPIILTEIGYGSVAGTTQAPSQWQTAGTPDPQEQANAYQGAFAALWGQPWLAGMYWWAWDVDPAKGGGADTSYTPQHKAAEAVLRAYFAK